MTIQTNPIFEAVLAYIEKGLPLVPVKGKAPFENGWQHAPIQDVERAKKLWSTIPELNVGLLLGSPSGIVALDFDYDEDGLHELIKQLVPSSPISKVGQKGETLLFRCSTELASKSWKNNNNMPIVECLAKGKQTVIPPSIHPDTKQPYRWQGKSLLDIDSVDELPELKHEHLTSIVALFKEKYGNVEPLPSESHQHELVRQALACVPAKDYHTWLTIGMALKHAFGEAGFELWDEWSQQSEKYQPGETAKKWASFHGHGVGLGTLYHHAKANGFKFPLRRVETRPVTEWSEPRPLPNSLPDVAPLSPLLLPEHFRAWCVDNADRLQVPLDFTAIPALITSSSLVGKKVGIRPKALDSWTVVINKWGGLVGPPSVMKSPAMKDPMSFMSRFERDARRDYDNALQDYKANKLIAKESNTSAKSKLRELIEKGGNAQELARRMVEVEEHPEPKRQRFLLNDTTVEKLGEVLADNENGVLLFRDELVGLFKNLEREGQDNARQFYLESWDGTNRFSYDRIGRGTIEIENNILSILGSIQPGPLSYYIRSAMRSGTSADGFSQRLQCLVYPDMPKLWRNIDRYPDETAREQAWKSYQWLKELTYKKVGAELDIHADIPFLRFEPSAQDAFNEWLEAWQNHLQTVDDHPAIIAHLAKYRSLIPELALWLHLVDLNTGPVTLKSLELACAWGSYFESHARRIYSLGMVANYEAAKLLMRKIKEGKLSIPFCARTLDRKGWSGMGTQEEVQLILDVLEEYGYLRSHMQNTGGRPSTQYYVHPEWRPAHHD